MLIGFIIFFGLISVGVGFGVMLSEECGGKASFFAAMLIFLLMFYFLLTVFYEEKGYKNGQIDAINGKIKWELELNESGETTWRETIENESNTE